MEKPGCHAELRRLNADLVLLYKTVFGIISTAVARYFKLLPLFTKSLTLEILAKYCS
jgi:hypothetical protein